MKTISIKKNECLSQAVSRKAFRPHAIMVVLVFVFSVSTVMADAELDPNTNNVTVDDTNSQADIDLANQLLDMEQAADTLENEIEDAAVYGEEPYAPDPDNPNEFLTGNEYIQEVIGQDNVDNVNAWREFYPEEPWAS